MSEAAARETRSSSPNPAFAAIASEAQIVRTVAALEAHGIHVTVVDSAAEAREVVLKMIPPGSEVFTSTSQTLESTGISASINDSGAFKALRPLLLALDRATQGKEFRQLAAAPDYVVGSVHAVTETGEVVIASASGSQLGPYASSAQHVIWVVGAQKLVPTLDEAFHRIEEYSLPLEDSRARKAYGRPSVVGKLLVVNRELVPDRVHMVLVRENLGF
ncbi:MAG: lactate utilization protein [Thermoplasmata archaeon]|nr:lactate utilization protein [Thermoplasmata archaeon]